MSIPIKAFSVSTDLDDRHGDIKFARHSIVAKRQFADEFGLDLCDVTCRRAPWADDYAEKPIPASVMIGHGWRFECCGCGAEVGEDWLADEGLSVAGVIGTLHSRVYCQQSCKDADDARRAACKAAEQRMLTVLRKAVSRRFPQAEFVTDGFKEHAYASFHESGCVVEQARVSFTFPGMKIGPAGLHLERDYSVKAGPVAPQFFCCSGDREAFEEYAQTRRP